MTNHNIVSPVIESRDSLSSKLLNTTFAQYDSVGIGLYRPLVISSSQYSNPLEARLTYYKYDVKGNPLDVAKTGDAHTVYLWSYNYQYPVAKIEGISYSDLVNNYYSQSSIDNLARTVLPDKSQIDGIRSALSSNANVLVTTYTYAPLIGVVTITDPRGMFFIYTYDTFNRLLNIQDNKESILNEYRYHYYNQP
jgi:hypothetical protein